MAFSDIQRHSDSYYTIKDSVVIGFRGLCTASRVRLILRGTIVRGDIVWDLESNYIWSDFFFFLEK